MSKKSRVRTSIKMYDSGEEVVLYDALFLKDGSIVIKEAGKKYEHHHLYTDKKGKIRSHRKDEKTNQKTTHDMTLSDIRAKIIKKFINES